MRRVPSSLPVAPPPLYRALPVTCRRHRDARAVVSAGGAATTVQSFACDVQEAQRRARRRRVPSCRYRHSKELSV